MKLCAWSALIFVATTATSWSADPLPALLETEVISTLDNVRQGVRYWSPAEDEPRPLLVLLHTWSGDYKQERSDWLAEAVERKWHYIQPDFRGPNNRPEACGSELARQDVIDALDWALGEFKVDQSRIYLAGVSGGGHMTMLMAGYAPQRFSAASAWVGISDLAAWYEFHAPEGKADKYGQMIFRSCGGVPSESDSIDAEYKSRSPLTVLARATQLPLDLNAGVHDGHTGSVPVSHTLLAYNAVVGAAGGEMILPEEIEQLVRDEKLLSPGPSDTAVDPDYGVPLYLRRSQGLTRVTIFEGGHEAKTHAACEWLSRQQRKAASPISK